MIVYMVTIYHILPFSTHLMAGEAGKKNIKTTVYLDSRDYRKLKGIAQAEGRSAADLIREAVAEYARRQTKHVQPRSIGSARSRRGDLAERDEELLDGFGSEG